MELTDIRLEIDGLEEIEFLLEISFGLEEDPLFVEGTRHTTFGFTRLYYGLNFQNLLDWST